MKVNILLESNEKIDKSAVIIIGRFNPPTVAHEKLIKHGINLARKNKAEFFLYTTGSHDNKKNPLLPYEKIYLLNELFPGIKTSVVKNIYDDVFVNLYKNGYNKIYFISGSDRGEEYKRMIERGTRKGDFNLNVNFITVDRRIISHDGIEDISATKARYLAKSGNFEEFSKIMAGKNLVLKKKVYSIIRERLQN